MSNWWKVAQNKIKDFEDRNIWNARIDDLKKITVTLDKLSKLVYQTGTTSKEIFSQILDTKRLSPYPSIQGLVAAADEICLDSPQKAADLCKKAAQEVILRVHKLEAERRSFSRTEKDDSKGRKGWKIDE